MWLAIGSRVHQVHWNGMGVAESTVHRSREDNGERRNQGGQPSEDGQRRNFQGVRMSRKRRCIRLSGGLIDGSAFSHRAIQRADRAARLVRPSGSVCEVVTCWVTGADKRGQWLVRVVGGRHQGHVGRVKPPRGEGPQKDCYVNLKLKEVGGALRLFWTDETRVTKPMLIVEPGPPTRERPERVTGSPSLGSKNQKGGPSRPTRQEQPPPETGRQRRKDRKKLPKPSESGPNTLCVYCARLISTGEMEKHIAFHRSRGHAAQFRHARSTHKRKKREKDLTATVNQSSTTPNEEVGTNNSPARSAKPAQRPRQVTASQFLEGARESNYAVLVGPKGLQPIKLYRSELRRLARRVVPDRLIIVASKRPGSRHYRVASAPLGPICDILVDTPPAGQDAHWNLSVDLDAGKLYVGEFALDILSSADNG